MPRRAPERGPDLDRMGIFREMEYVTIGDKYTSPAYPRPILTGAGKGRQMLAPQSKTRTSAQDGYFGKSFERIFIKEAYHDPVAHRRKERLKESQKNIGKPFLPSSPPKLQVGLGNPIGTFGGKVDHFSPVTRPKQSGSKEKRNIFTAPPKQGTGYGYPNVLIGKVPKHEPDPLDVTVKERVKEHARHKALMKGGPFRLNTHPHDLFDANPGKVEKPSPPFRELKPAREKITPFKPSSPAKAAGGAHLGTFEAYPEHSKEPYPKRPPPIRDLTSKKRPTGAPLVFRPQPPCDKSVRTGSIVAKNVTRRMNVTNFDSTVPVFG